MTFDRKRETGGCLSPHQTLEYLVTFLSRDQNLFPPCILVKNQDLCIYRHEILITFITVLHIILQYITFFLLLIWSPKLLK